jgi:HAMP domain-containing protein
MRLLFKFNLIFALVFAAGLLGCGYLTRSLLQRNAQEEILENARLLMESSIAVRNYTSSQIKPLLETQMKYSFLPQSVPAYSATEVLHTLAKKYPEYGYKEATLNPTNPRDRAVEWEADIVNRFRGTPEQTELSGERDTPLGRMLYIARPIKISNPACLACHSTVEAAPRPMLDKYGPANGFSWTLNEIVGAQVVSVPMALPLARAEETFKVFMLSLGGLFLAIAVLLNLMLWLTVIRPVTRLSSLADRVSLGEMEAPEFALGTGDEIGILAASFSRMRRSLEQAMKMLDAV